MAIMSYKKYNPYLEEEVFIAPNAYLIGDVEVASNVGVWFGVTVRGDSGKIYIGQGSNIQDNSVLHCSDYIETRIGKNVTVGHSCVIHSCKIEDNCLIGMGSTVLDDAIIGKNCIVGANSLVTKGKIFDEGMLIMGSPAKAVRKLTEEEIRGITKNALHYQELAQSYRL